MQLSYTPKTLTCATVAVMGKETGCGLWFADTEMAYYWKFTQELDRAVLIVLGSTILKIYPQTACLLVPKHYRNLMYSHNQVQRDLAALYKTHSSTGMPQLFKSAGKVDHTAKVKIPLKHYNKSYELDRAQSL